MIYQFNLEPVASRFHGAVSQYSAPDLITSDNLNQRLARLESFTQTIIELIFTRKNSDYIIHQENEAKNILRCYGMDDIAGSRLLNDVYLILYNMFYTQFKEMFDTYECPAKFQKCTVSAKRHIVTCQITISEPSDYNGFKN